MLQFCMASWKQHLPDYEFILWNETNTVFDCEYVKKAFAEEKWAFVSDYVRLKAIYEYGGVYLDTDMLLLESINKFLDNDCFFVAEHTNSIGVGIFGAVKNHFFIGLCLKKYREAFTEFHVIPRIINRIFRGHFNYFGNYYEDLFLKEVVIYKPTYFYALPYTKYYDIHHYKNYVTAESYGVHLWYGSWHDYNPLVHFRRKEFLSGFKVLWRLFLKGELFKPQYLKKVLVALKDGLVTRNAFK